jgi:hypothetical protein
MRVLTSFTSSKKSYGFSSDFFLSLTAWILRSAAVNIPAPPPPPVSPILAVDALDKRGFDFFLAGIMSSSSPSSELRTRALEFLSCFDLEVDFLGAECEEREASSKMSGPSSSSSSSEGTMKSSSAFVVLRRFVGRTVQGGNERRDYI